MSPSKYCAGFLSMLTLIIHSHGLDSSKRVKEFNCASYSRFTHLRFYSGPEDYDYDTKICRRPYIYILNDTLYETVKTCIHRELKKEGEYTLCLLIEATGLIGAKKSTEQEFTITTDYDHCSFVCVQHDQIITTFIMTVKNVSGSRVVDLLSPAYQPGHVVSVQLGETLTLTCKAKGHPKPQLLFKTNGNDIEKFSRTGSSVKINMVADKCGDMGTFTCENKNYSLNMGISITVHSSLQFCDGQDQVELVTATSGRTLFSFCVRTCPNMLHGLTFNNTKVDRHTDKHFHWDMEQIGASSLYNVTVTFRDMASLTCGDLTIGVSNDLVKEYVLNYTVVIKCNAEARLRSEHPSVTIPVTLVAVAVTMAICCSFCVMCGVIIYRIPKTKPGTSGWPRKYNLPGNTSRRGHSNGGGSNHKDGTLCDEVNDGHYTSLACLQSGAKKNVNLNVTSIRGHIDVIGDQPTHYSEIIDGHPNGERYEMLDLRTKKT